MNKDTAHKAVSTGMCDWYVISHTGQLSLLRSVGWKGATETETTYISL